MGRSALLQASDTLHVNVSQLVDIQEEGVQLKNYDSVPELSEYEPFHSEIDFSSRIPSSSSDTSKVEAFHRRLGTSLPQHGGGLSVWQNVWIQFLHL